MVYLRNLSNVLSMMVQHFFLAAQKLIRHMIVGKCPSLHFGMNLAMKNIFKSLEILKLIYFIIILNFD